ncbi:histone-lysine N-methyltransferase SUVR5-like [Hibiscus syriacus]|uniref:histone-lysine N-methyltransferase SUVR5-like n=1 Tax=Hibiscus syriacus TaxID=106335 RepID=UPI001921D1B9|nr:histone-lysine N-methyltransferase SUVR5-like [Hibiscus syriacus]
MNKRLGIKESYIVCKCNLMCSCNIACPNRLLQNGVRMKLKVFKTKNKVVVSNSGCILEFYPLTWLHVLPDSRYDTDGCNYTYNIDTHGNDMSRLIKGQVQYVINATKYGNVSRFINHSCSPNLVNHHVLVEGMDCHSAHIGL